LKILAILFLFINLIAQEQYSVRVAYGTASQSDLSEIISLNNENHLKHLGVFALDGGYLLSHKTFELPLDIYIKGGVSFFDESAVSQDDILETMLYIKAYWNFDFFDNRIRLGLGDGFSYTSSILYVEKEEALAKDDKNSYLLNYMDVSLDFDFGRLVSYKPLHNIYVGWALKHRSGIYGLLNDVRNGGSNYNIFYVEKNF
jgi:outer membrane protein